MFLDWMAGASAGEVRAAGQERREVRRQSATVEAARARVLAEFGAELNRLEERLPAGPLDEQMAST